MVAEMSIELGPALLCHSLPRADAFVVLGTIEGHLWRQGLSRPLAIDAVKKHMADFKAYLRVDLIPGGWSSKNTAR